MPNIGTYECSRCQLAAMQKEADFRNMVITMRKSLYGPKIENGRMVDVVPFAPTRGIDIYIHPRSTEIPRHHLYMHELNPASAETFAAMLPDDDPDKWWHGWLQEIPKKCECKPAT